MKGYKMGILWISDEAKSKFESGEEENSFEGLTEEQIRAHLSETRYGNFELTGAVFPNYNLEVVPQAGYRHDVYINESHGISIPVVMISLSAESLFQVFMDLIDLFSSPVDVVLETSQRLEDRDFKKHEDIYQKNVDTRVLKSILWDYEDLLVKDGCTGIVVIDPGVPMELQFDEHKLLIFYNPAPDVLGVLDQHKVPLKSEIKFIVEADHLHSTNDLFRGQFDELKIRLGMDEWQEDI